MAPRDADVKLESLVASCHAPVLANFGGDASAARRYVIELCQQGVAKQINDLGSNANKKTKDVMKWKRAYLEDHIWGDDRLKDLWDAGHKQQTMALIAVTWSTTKRTYMKSGEKRSTGQAAPATPDPAAASDSAEVTNLSTTPDPSSLFVGNTPSKHDIDIANLVPNPYRNVLKSQAKSMAPELLHLDLQRAPSRHSSRHERPQ